MGHKAFKFRLFPNAAQVKALGTTLYLCRSLYNAGRQERRDLSVSVHNLSVSVNNVSVSARYMAVSARYMSVSVKASAKGRKG